MQQSAVQSAEPDDFVFERQRVENRLDFRWFWGKGPSYFVSRQKEQDLSNETTYLEVKVLAEAMRTVTLCNLFT
ncbi:hypothetical protein AHMF7605_11155 [Adhaeribacter arboris]|uniref:Uncharacterized protein n=1 Tax=Adhaeribacter arboris TaxID=2072846 RepID=A0A2T2YEV1_9BACT|nr:hypothetical protein [Adhaeribacter arboris]PSR54039.1 hypothetical protein AHMF7605_11155 [Adhaeribacter arboris]